MTDEKKAKPVRTNHAIHEARLEVSPGRFLFGTIGGLVFVDLKGREFVLTSPSEVKSKVVVR